MASEQGAVTSAAPVFGTNLPESVTISAPPPINQPSTEPARTKSLKRGRHEQSENTPNPSTFANAGFGALPSPKSPRFKGNFAPAFAPIPLTGAAALEDERRKRQQREEAEKGAMSDNPGHKAISSLLAGGGSGMSRPQDAPTATTAMSSGMSVAANSVSIPSPMRFDEKSETSPASVTSLASLGTAAQTATASSTVVASPVPMNSAIEAEGRNNRTNPPHLPDDQHANRALTFPGNLLGLADPARASQRGMSLPTPNQNQQLAPRSPSQKKHKCPYCETEFTRHHNLKSHLLTHSQEKPYVCQTCSMRFRRLHDLKRHMKLHTGERPHICPKCERKFARGDALARHSKGQGGCAGRRPSMDGFAGEDDFDGSNAGEGEDGAMEGLMYSNGTRNPGENEMTEEERRRSLPSIMAQHLGGSQGSQEKYTARTPSTYPPVGPRPGQTPGGLYPPGSDRMGSSSTGTTTSLQNSVGGHNPHGSISSLPLNTGGGSMFSQSGMTESPKPLSPAGMHSHQLGHDPASINRQRSPSLTTQFQQQHFGRRQSTRASPPGMSLPSPHGTSHGPKLPAIAGLTPVDQRYAHQSQAPGQQGHNGSYGQPGQLGTEANQASPMFQPPMGPAHSRGGSGSSSHQQGTGSGDSSNNLFAGGDPRMWTYVQTLEEKVKQLSEKMLAMENKERSQEDKITRLTEEVTSLKSQLNAQSQQQPPSVLGHS